MRVVAPSDCACHPADGAGRAQGEAVSWKGWRGGGTGTPGGEAGPGNGRLVGPAGGIGPVIGPAAPGNGGGGGHPGPTGWPGNGGGQEPGCCQGAPTGTARRLRRCAAISTPAP